MAIGNPPSMTPANSGARRGADAAHHRQQQQRQALEEGEPLGAHRAERAGVERAADAGHGGREREDASLSRVTSMPSVAHGGGAVLHRQQALAEGAAADGDHHR